MKTHRISGSWWNYVLFNTEGQGGGGTPPVPGNSTPPVPGVPSTHGSDGSAPWYQSVGVSAEHHDFLRNKEFADINVALSSYKSLEGLVGRQRLAVPKDANDQAAWDAIYGAVGRPADAKGYKQPDGIKIEDKAWERFTGIFHKHGIGQAQAEAIVKEYYAFGGEGQKAKDDARAAQEAIEETALKKAWGKDFDANSDIAGRAWRALGMTEEMSNKIEEALGFKAFTEFFHKIGSGMSEAAMKVDQGGGGSGAASVEAAKSQRDRLLGDPEFQKRYTNSNQAIRNKAIEEIQPYIKIIADAKDAARAAGKELG